MSKIAYVNGKYLTTKNASLSINDRSIHFSDAIYEVVAVYEGKLVFWKEHIARLKKSLSMLDINNFHNTRNLIFKCEEIIELNNLKFGLIYIQISRGIASRNHNWQKDIKPSLIISALHKDVFKVKKSISLISNKDIRWKLSNIKTTSLLGNVLLKQKALKSNSFECVMYDEKKMITEATTSNIWIIKNKNLFTPPLTKNILPGVTRKIVFQIASDLNIKATEKNISMYTLINSDGVFLTNSSSLLLLANKIDNLKLNNDKDNISKLIYNKLIELIKNHDKEAIRI